MKTSNILISSALAGLFIFVTVYVFIEKANYKDKLKNGKTEITNNQKSKDLESFKIIKISDDAFVKVISSEQNKLYYNDKADIETNVFVNNDTLYISGNKNILTVNSKDVHTILISDNAVAEIEDIKTDSLNIYMFNDARLIGNNLNISNLQLYTNDNSSVFINKFSFINNVFLQSEENSKLRLICKIKKISGSTTADTELVIKKVKSINLQAEGNLTILND